MDSDSTFGYTNSKQVGFKAPIIGILGDQQAALFAQCGEDETRIKNTYGTGLFMMKNTKTFSINQITLSAQLPGYKTNAIHTLLKEVHFQELRACNGVEIN